MYLLVTTLHRTANLS